MISSKELLIRNHINLLSIQLFSAVIVTACSFIQRLYAQLEYVNNPKKGTVMNSLVLVEFDEFSTGNLFSGIV